MDIRVILTLVLSITGAFIQGQNQQLKFDPNKWPTHQVVHYSKANWDGSNQALISVYFKDDQWVEALKWHQGQAEATVIPAKIDHETFNVSHFRNLHCENGECQLRGEMYWNTEIDGFILQLGDRIDTVVNMPSYWHSYDFDFTSLMVAFLFKNNTKPHVFQRADFYESEGGFKFGPMGEITMEYKGEKTFKNSKCHLFTIDGPGLNNQGGEIWFDQDSQLLKGFKIKEPDESSYNSVDYQYLGKEQMSGEEWETFKQKKY